MRLDGRVDDMCDIRTTSRQHRSYLVSATLFDDGYADHPPVAISYIVRRASHQHDLAQGLHYLVVPHMVGIALEWVDIFDRNGCNKF